MSVATTWSGCKAIVDTRYKWFDLSMLAFIVFRTYIYILLFCKIKNRWKSPLFLYSVPFFLCSCVIRRHEQRPTRPGFYTYTLGMGCSGDLLYLHYYKLKDGVLSWLNLVQVFNERRGSNVSVMLTMLFSHCLAEDRIAVCNFDWFMPTQKGILNKNRKEMMKKIKILHERHECSDKQSIFHIFLNSWLYSWRTARQHEPWCQSPWRMKGARFSVLLLPCLI